MSNNLEMLRTLASLAKLRTARGDKDLVLNPVFQSQEQFEAPPEFESDENQGLVLEGEDFEIVKLGTRKKSAKISGFCDGIRSTFFVGHEDQMPLLFTSNAAAVRTRDGNGYHIRFHDFQRQHQTLLAPFSLFKVSIRKTYEQLGLCPRKSSDLCFTDPLNETEEGIRPSQIPFMGNLAWQARALRRARTLLDESEEIVTLAGAQLLRDQEPDGSQWLLKDGSLIQFNNKYLSPRQNAAISNVVCCVKTHPVPFFGVKGERMMAKLEIGERSVAFLPRPRSEAHRNPPKTLDNSSRQIISWYLRVSPPNPQNPSNLSGVVRLDIAAINDWKEWIEQWIEPVSWAVLDEFWSLSARPDPRYDVMPYGIYDVEQFLKAQKVSGELLLAQLC